MDDLVVDRTEQEQHSSVASIMVQMHNNNNNNNTNNNNNKNNNIVSLSQIEVGVTQTQNVDVSANEQGSNLMQVLQTPVKQLSTTTTTTRTTMVAHELSNSSTSKIPFYQPGQNELIPEVVYLLVDPFLSKDFNIHNTLIDGVDYPLYEFLEGHLNKKILPLIVNSNSVPYKDFKINLSLSQHQVHVLILEQY